MNFVTIHHAADRLARVIGRAGAQSLRRYLEDLAHTDSLPTVDSLPERIVLDLPEHGPTHVVDLPGPTPDAPTILLLHAIGTTGYLTWFPVVHRLAQTHRVVTLDHRWHGRGIPSDCFSLEDCADDAAAVLRLLGISEAIVAGYSMGGATAQLVWRRHPELVSGLVLCSTSSQWRRNVADGAFYALIGGLNRTLFGSASRHIRLHHERRADIDDEVIDIVGWCLRELRSTSPWAFPGAMHALGTFASTAWLAEVDVPTAVVITTKDRAVSPHQQRRLAESIPGARVYEVAGGHTSLMFARDVWQPTFLEAVTDITNDIQHRGRTAERRNTCDAGMR